MAISTTAADFTYRTAWAQGHFGDALLDYWDDLDDDGQLDEREEQGAAAPVASLAAHLTLDPSARASATFLLTWLFPNRVTWTPAAAPTDPASEEPGCGEAPTAPGFVGNH